MPAIKPDNTVMQTKESQAFGPYTWAEPNALAGLFGHGSGLSLTLNFNPGDPGIDTSVPGQLSIGAANATLIDIDPSAAFSADLRRSLQTVTEAVLVSGVNAVLGEIVSPVALTAARLVGAPLNPAAGQRLTFVLLQDGTGGRAVTWNAIFKVSWSDVGNTLSKRSIISFEYDGTSWNQDGAQVPYI